MDNKWVAVWGNATSVTGNFPERYGKNFTLRYTVRNVFDASAIRLRFSNITGEDDITITRAFISLGNNFIPVTFKGSETGVIPAGEENNSDEISVNIKRGEDITVSMYFEGFTDMSSAIYTEGPLERGMYAEGDFSDTADIPPEKSAPIGRCYFLNTVSVLTGSDKHAAVMFGDSITAQSWPDWLTLRLFEKGVDNCSVIRRGVSGARVLGQYDCVQYRGYGLSGKNRYEREITTDGADRVIVFYGINDIIHPDGENIFRPWSNYPTAEQMINAFKEYIEIAHEKGMKIYFATLLPIKGWRTYLPKRDELRCEINNWIRTNTEADGFVDFDKALRDPEDIQSLKPEYNSGDCLHPSIDGAKAIAGCIDLDILN